MDKQPVPAAMESVSHNARRKFLTMAISTMLMDAGFDQIEKQCLETLCEMLQSRKYKLLLLLFINPINSALHPFRSAL